MRDAFTADKHPHTVTPTTSTPTSQQPHSLTQLAVSREMQLLAATAQSEHNNCIVRLHKIIMGTRAARTLGAYTSLWNRFERWCAETNRTAFPAKPHDVVLFLVVVASTSKTYASMTWQSTTRLMPVSPAKIQRQRHLQGAQKKQPLTQAHCDTTLGRRICECWRQVLPSLDRL